MDEWSSVLQSGKVNVVRNPKQTCSAIAVMAALFKLMGKVTTNNVLVFVQETFLHCAFFCFFSKNLRIFQEDF